MRVTKCDTCGSEHARTYQYDNGKRIDLCVNCVQEWVLKNQKKLTEATDGGKKIIFG